MDTLAILLVNSAALFVLFVILLVVMILRNPSTRIRKRITRDLKKIKAQVLVQGS